MPAGLDQISEDTSVDESVPGEVVNIGAPKVKGGLDIKGKIGMDPTETKAILAAMQDIVDERQGPLNQFMQGISKARAVTYGPDAYAKEAARQSAEQAQTQSYMQQMAAMRAASKAAEQRAQYMAGPAGGGAAAAPSAAQGQPQGAANIGAQAGQSRWDALTQGLTGPQKIAADSYRQEGDFDSVIKMVQASALKRPDTLRILDEINSLPEGSPQRDMLLRQTFKEAYTPQTVETDQGTFKYSPSYTIPSQFRGQGQAPAAGGGAGVNTQDIRKVEYGDLPPGVVSPKGAESGMQVMPATQAAPGFGVTPARDNSDAEKERVGRDYFNALKDRYGNDTIAAVAYNMGPGKTEEWIKGGMQFNKLPAETQAYIGRVHTASAARNMQPTSAGPTAVVEGFSPRSEQGRELAKESMKGTTKLFEDNIQKPMMTKQAHDVQNMTVDKINNAIKVVDSNKFGPGTESGKVFLELKGAIPGFNLSKKEMDRLASIKTLDQASKELTLGSVKSSLTGSTSDSDRQYLQDAMFSINDPKKFIKATLETAKAGAVLNNEILTYLNKPENAYRKQQAYDEFLASGKARAILEREAPTAFADYKGKAPAPSAPAGDIQSVLKASNTPYEPEKYEYRISSDGSVQRRKK